MTLAEKVQARAILKDIGELFGGACEICLEECTDGKGYTIHHLDDDDSEKHWQDFRVGHTGKSLKDAERVRYYQYLLRHIKAMSANDRDNRYAFIHSKHHQIISRVRQFKSNDTIQRLFEIILATKHTTGRQKR